MRVLRLVVLSLVAVVAGATFVTLAQGLQQMPNPDVDRMGVALANTDKRVAELTKAVADLKGQTVKRIGVANCNSIRPQSVLTLGKPSPLSCPANQVLSGVQIGLAANSSTPTLNIEASCCDLTVVR